MEELLNELLLALNDAGIRAMEALPSAVMPRLKEPMTTVRVERARAAECALGRHLGERDDPETGPEAVRGRALELTAALRVASPTALGGGRCFREANRLMDALLAGAGGLDFSEITQEKCRYDRDTDQFFCDVRAVLRAQLTAEPPETGDGQPLADVIVQRMD